MAEKEYQNNTKTYENHLFPKLTPSENDSEYKYNTEYTEIGDVRLNVSEGTNSVYEDAEAGGYEVAKELQSEVNVSADGDYAVLSHKKEDHTYADLTIVAKDDYPRSGSTANKTGCLQTKRMVIVVIASLVVLVVVLAVVIGVLLASKPNGDGGDDADGSEIDDIVTGILCTTFLSTNVSKYYDNRRSRTFTSAAVDKQAAVQQ